MEDIKFDPKKLKKLNNPERLKDIPPDYVQSRLKLENPEVLLEIGAGTAFFSVAFLRLYEASTLYACDSSDTMLRWMKENITPEYPAIVPVKNEESSIPLDDGVADLAFTINLHHELENPRLMLKEAFRLVKPGGGIFIVDWLKKDMDEGPPTRIRCLARDVREQLVHAGFTGVEDYEELPKHFLVVGNKPASSR